MHMSEKMSFEAIAATPLASRSLAFLGDLEERTLARPLLSFGH